MALSRAALVQHWLNSFGTAPPKGIKRGLLERACAWQLQAQAFGGLKAATRKALLAIADGGNPSGHQSGRSLKPGSRLVRQWRGVAHRVDVTASGFLWNGRSYASLSAVAFAITGAPRSGPLFFGL